MTFPTMGKFPLQAGLVVTHGSQWTPEPSTMDHKETWSGSHKHSGEHQPATPMLQQSPHHPEMSMNVNWDGLGTSTKQNVFIWEQEKWNVLTENIKMKHFLVSSNTSVYAINSQCHEGLSTWMEDAVSSPAPLVLSWMVFIGWIALPPNIQAPQRAPHLSLRGRLQFSWP